MADKVYQSILIKTKEIAVCNYITRTSKGAYFFYCLYILYTLLISRRFLRTFLKTKRKIFRCIPITYYLGGEIITLLPPPGYATYNIVIVNYISYFYLNILYIILRFYIYIFIVIGIRFLLRIVLYCIGRYVNII